MEQITDYIYTVNAGHPISPAGEEMVAPFQWNAEVDAEGVWKISYPKLKDPSDDAKKIQKILDRYQRKVLGN